MNVVITGEEFNETLSFFLRLRLIYAFEKKKKNIRKNRYEHRGNLLSQLIIFPQSCRERFSFSFFFLFRKIVIVELIKI